MLFAGWVGGAALCAGAGLPPLTGELGGEVRIDAAELGRGLGVTLPAGALNGLRLKWTARLAGDGVAVEGRGAGVDLALKASPEAGGGWAWKIERGRLEITELWPELRGLVGGKAGQWSASGWVALSGSGRWDADAGLRGEFGLALREGWARSEADGIEVSGVELELTTTDLAGFTLPAGQVLRVAKASAAGTELRDARVDFGLDAKRVVNVAGGEAVFLEGRLRLQPFAAPLSEPRVVVAADVEALPLGEVASLMPWLLRTAQGRLRGRVELAWDGVKGLRVRDGGLDIVRSDDAAFRLAPSPGLLTGSMGSRFRLLPWRWARWVSMNNPAYRPLKDIESGREGLRIETFRVTFWPDGAGVGRPATIHIVGKPLSGELVDELVLDVNFHGPLTEVMGFGLNQDFAGFEFRME